MELDLILKVGGSCISDKTLVYKAMKTQSLEDIKAALDIDLNKIDLITAEIGKAYSIMNKVIILTGVGSPGHFTVLKHKLHKGNSGDLEQHLGLLEAQIAVNRLRQSILESFLRHKIPAFQAYASSIYESDKMRVIKGDTGNIKRFLESGLVPVISGDMVPDVTMGYSVLSGDQILADLAKKFKPKKIVYGSDVDGIFDSDPKLNPNSSLIPKISRNEIDSLIDQISGEDASGQMRGKIMEIRNLLDAGFKDILLLNLTKRGILSRALNNEDVHYTRFH